MERYIKKSALVAEIERLIKSFKVISAVSPSRDTTLENIAKAALCRQILSFIDILEVKEVSLEDLKEELDRVVKIYKPDGDFGWGTLYNIAKHFFELGMQQSNNGNNNEEKS